MEKNIPHIIDIFTHSDQRGHLGVIEEKDIPFAIKRIYYLYEVPDNEVRGVHAHKQLQQIMVAMHGSVDVTLTKDGKEYKFTLDNPNKGLYVPPMTWRELNNFKNGAVCCVLASLEYDIEDYIFDKNEFLKVTE